MSDITKGCAFSSRQMRVIRESYERGIPQDVVNLYRRPELTMTSMEVIQDCVLKKFPIEYIKYMANQYLEEKAIVLMSFVFENAIEQKYEITESDVEAFAKFSRNQSGYNDLYPVFCQMVADKIDVRVVLLAMNRELNEHQLRQLYAAAKVNLSLEALDLIANNNICSDEMHELALGFEHGLTKEQVISMMVYEIEDNNVEQDNLDNESTRF